MCVAPPGEDRRAAGAEHQRARGRQYRRVEVAAERELLDFEHAVEHQLDAPQAGVVVDRRAMRGRPFDQQAGVAVTAAGEQVAVVGRVEAGPADTRGCLVRSSAGAWGYADGWEARHDA